METFVLQNFEDYELIDSGDGYKLERFGKYILARPEPQAIWNKSMSDLEWEELYQAKFIRSKEIIASNKDDSGSWHKKQGMPEQWKMKYQYKGVVFNFKLALTSFKHIGLFPEQAFNWSYILDQKTLLEGKKALNLFAYTGAASMAFKASGADIVHLDAVKRNIEWGKENMLDSNLKDIRWIVEDAVKFAQREVKRGNEYSAIILDPPAYGRGPDGEKWILADQLNELLSLCNKLLIKKDSLFIINLYSMGYSVTMLETLVKFNFGTKTQADKGELVLKDRFGKFLPTGILYRFKQ